MRERSAEDLSFDHVIIIRYHCCVFLCHWNPTRVDSCKCKRWFLCFCHAARNDPNFYWSYIANQFVKSWVRVWFFFHILTLIISSSYYSTAFYFLKIRSACVKRLFLIRTGDNLRKSTKAHEYRKRAKNKPLTSLSLVEIPLHLLDPNWLSGKRTACSPAWRRRSRVKGCSRGWLDTFDMWSAS